MVSTDKKEVEVKAGELPESFTVYSLSIPTSKIADLKTAFAASTDKLRNELGIVAKATVKPVEEIFALYLFDEAFKEAVEYAYEKRKRVAGKIVPLLMAQQNISREAAFALLGFGE